MKLGSPTWSDLGRPGDSSWQCPPRSRGDAMSSVTFAFCFFVSEPGGHPEGVLTPGLESTLTPPTLRRLIFLSESTVRLFLDEKGLFAHLWKAGLLAKHN